MTMCDFARKGRLLVLLSCLGLGAGAMAQQPAAPAVAVGAAPGEAQLTAYRRLFQVLNVELVFRHMFGHPPPDHPEMAYLYRYLLEHVSSEEIFQLYLPDYARHLSVDSARRIAAFYQTAAGRKALAGLTAAALQVQAPEPSLSVDEARAAAVFEASIAASELKDTYADTGHFAVAIKAFVERYTLQMAASAVRSLQTYAEVNATLPSLRTAPPMPIELTGNAAFDSRLRIAAQGNLQLSTYFFQTYEDVLSLHMKTGLMAEELMSHDKLADSRQKMDLAEQRVDRFLVTVQTTLRANVQAMRAVPDLDAQSVLAYARGMEKTLDWLRRFGDNLHQRIAIARAISTLVESCLDTLTSDAGRLQFGRPADASKYKQLSAQLVVLQTGARSLEQERRLAFRASFNELASANPQP